MTRRPVDPDSVVWDSDGLVPVVVQDARTAEVLMVAYMNRQSLEQTITSNDVWFWSRSRQDLWRKGATSGHTLRLVDFSADCDGDTLLARVDPSGPACHTGTRSCFALDEASTPPAFASLDHLYRTMSDRVKDRPAGSYTTRLIDGGPDLPARKLTEEAVEVLIAAKDHATGTGDDGRLTEELADVLYHLLAVVIERGVDPAAIMSELRRRER